MSDEPNKAIVKVAQLDLGTEPGRIDPSGDEELWEKASRWAHQELEPVEVADLLSTFSYHVDKSGLWESAPDSESGPWLELHANSHFEEKGHTWYRIHCRLFVDQDSLRHAVRCEAPRRLCMLRQFLHDRIKAQLGDSYSSYFGETPFARYGGVKGTTARLGSWLKAVARFINSGKAPPSLVAHTISFFKMPSKLEPLPPSEIWLGFRKCKRQLALIFDSLDANHKGCIGWEELEANIGKNDPDKAARLIEIAKTSLDEKIHWVEFIQFIEEMMSQEWLSMDTVTQEHMDGFRSLFSVQSGEGQ